MGTRVEGGKTVKMCMGSRVVVVTEAVTMGGAAVEREREECGMRDGSGR